MSARAHGPDDLYDTELWETDPHTSQIELHRAEICQELCQRLAKDVQNALDLGCGQGYLTRQIETWMPGVDLYACDVSSPRLQRGYWGTRTRRFVGDARHVPCRDSQFGLVILWSVLDHINGFEGALREAWRILRPNGWLLIQSNLFNRFVRLDPPDPLMHYQYFSYSSLVRYLRMAGFEIVDHVGNGFPSQLISLPGKQLLSPYGSVTKRLPWLFVPLRWMGQVFPSWAFDVTILAKKV